MVLESVATSAGIEKIFELVSGVLPIVGSTVGSVIERNNKSLPECKKETSKNITFKNPRNFTVNIYVNSDSVCPISYVDEKKTLDISIK